MPLTATPVTTAAPRAIAAPASPALTARVQPAPLVDERPVMSIAADLALIGAGYQVHRVIEHPGEQRLLFAERRNARA